MLHFIVEQTKEYKMRMIYDPKTGSFSESENVSLTYQRGFSKPYGWIKESGTTPFLHRDCILMTEKEYGLGDEVGIKVIGVFKRNDFDHKYVAVELSREIDDISLLSEKEKDELHKLYPRVGEGEGWFGREEAEKLMKTHPKAL